MNRDLVRPLVIATVAESALLALLIVTGAGGLSFLYLPIGIAMGYRFGPRAGALAVSLPMVGIILGQSSDSLAVRVEFLAFAMLIVGGSAWFVGTLRERYGRPPWRHGARYLG